MDKIQINIEQNVNELISKFKSSQYKQYKEHLNKALTVETIDTDKIKLYLPSNKVVIYKCPQYSYVDEMLNSLYKKYNDYIINSLNGNNLQQENIWEVLKHITTLHYYLIKVNSKFEDKIDKYTKQIKEISEYLQSDKTEIQQQQKYFESWDEMTQIVDKLKVIKSKLKVNYIIDILPELVEEGTYVKKGKEKSRQKTGMKTNKQDKNSSSDTKFPFNKLPVKLNSVEECNSRSRSKRYYISLKDLILSIEKDDELKRIFGPRFKQLSKKDICNIMFNQKN